VAVLDKSRMPKSVAAGSRSRVLVIASDRRFRTVAATLLTQHGYDVAVGGRGEDITELALRERADVVVIDASASLTVAARQAARLGLLRPRVRVVAVSDGDGAGLAALPVLPKWSSFDEVFEAIERARAEDARGGLTHVSP
jgi:DNA-binding NtrC family response regulator